MFIPYFRNFIAKSDKKPKSKNGMHETEITIVWQKRSFKQWNQIWIWSRKELRRKTGFDSIILHLQKFVDNVQQCFAFTPQAKVPAHNLKVNVTGSNPGYLLKSLLLYTHDFFFHFFSCLNFYNSIEVNESSQFLFWIMMINKNIIFHLLSITQFISKNI